MSEREHELIFNMLNDHKSIKRTVHDLPDGVETTTTTSRPELVKALRAHVKQMVDRLESGRPVRMWDPPFRDVFDHADQIKVATAETDNGIVVTETSEDAKVVSMIQAHARAVSRFVAEGHAAARPPWAGGNR